MTFTLGNGALSGASDVAMSNIENDDVLFDTQDTSKWSWEGAAAVSGGALVLPLSPTKASVWTNATDFDLTESSIEFEFESPVTGTGIGGEQGIDLYLPGENSHFGIALGNGDTIVCREVVDGSWDQTFPNWQSAGSPFKFRIRHTGSTVYWETAPSGSDSWTIRRQKAPSIALTPLSVRIHGDASATPGTSRIARVGTESQVDTQWIRRGGTWLPVTIRLRRNGAWAN